MTSLADQALYLHSLGFSVIPLGGAGTARAKKPREQWRSFSRVRACEEQVDTWWEDDPNANIGIITGKVSDLVVVDCDDQAAIDWHNAHCVGTPVMVETGKGAHFYYRYPGSENAAEWLRGLRKELQDAGLHVDLQADGRYVVAPGSVHENGKPYATRPADALDFWEQNIVLEFALATQQQRANLADIDLSGIRASFGQIAEGRRNDSLASYAGALVKTGLNYQDVLRELLAHNAAMCDPALPKREVVQIVSSIFRTHERNHSGQTSGQVAGNSQPVAPDREELDLVNEDPLAQFSLPQEIVNPGGILQQIIDYTEGAAVRTHRYFALAGAIALMGTLLGQRICTETGLTTNMYCLAIGGSTSGKDAPKRALAKLLSTATQGMAYGGSDVASDVALLSVLKEQPRSCFVFDEIGMLLKSCKSPNSARAGVIKLLTELYSCYDSPYVKTYANKENNKIIHWQALSVFGLSVPEEFYGAITDGEASNGFLGRVLVFESTDEPGPRKLNTCRAIPKALKDALAALWAIDGGEHQHHDGDPLNVPIAHPQVITRDDQARDLHECQIRETDQLATGQARGGDNAAASLLGRLPEHADKLALIHAASRLGAEVVNGRITIDDMIWGWRLARFLTRRMLVQLRNSVHESEFDSWQQRVTRAIFSHIRKEKARGIEKPGASRYIIERALSNVPTRVVGDVLTKMEQKRVLWLEKGWRGPGAKKPADLYCVARDKDADSE